MELNQTTTTVYFLIYPETKNVIDELWGSKPHEMYTEPWTKKQDSMHETFFEKYLDWVKPVIDTTHLKEEFPYYYPTNGSSEAIRDVIMTYASICKHPRIHIFAGEYEGYKAIAQPIGVPVIEHFRDLWRESLTHGNTFTDTDLFILSQPSSINGNVWNEYNAFLDFMKKEYPNVGIALDLCYVGVTKNDIKPILINDNVKFVFFSLSKVYGVYYHRIGGVYSRDVLPGLIGNKWFKNLFSLQLGTELMTRYSLGELPRKYEGFQLEICSKLNITPSDVVLLGNNITQHNTPYFRSYASGGSGVHNSNRYCITPLLQKIIQDANS